MHPGNQCRSESEFIGAAHFQKCLQVFLYVIQFPGELSPKLFFRLHLSVATVSLGRALALD
jgi:hypothetical protein